MTTTTKLCNIQLQPTGMLQELRKGFLGELCKA
jgi:hypothetical protein